MDYRGTHPDRNFQPEAIRAGTNWGYAHTNYTILGRILEKITGMPLAEDILIVLISLIEQRSAIAITRIME